MQLARRSKELGLLDYSTALQKRHDAATPAETRKQKGQVFTPPSVCSFYGWPVHANSRAF